MIFGTPPVSFGFFFPCFFQLLESQRFHIEYNLPQKKLAHMLLMSYSFFSGYSFSKLGNLSSEEDIYREEDLSKPGSDSEVPNETA